MYTNDSTRSMVDRKISQFVKQNQNRETLAKRFQWFTGIVLHGNCCKCSASKLMLTWNENRETLESFCKQNVGIIQLALAPRHASLHCDCIESYWQFETFR